MIFLDFSGPNMQIEVRQNNVSMVGNFKFEVTNYLSDLYGPGGATHLGCGGDDDDDDDDDGGGEEEDSEATPSYQPRKRRHC